MSDFNDWLAIANVKAAYCRLLDTKDWQGWGELFTEDAVLDVTGSGSLGVGGIARSARKTPPGTGKNRQHQQNRGDHRQ